MYKAFEQGEMVSIVHERSTVRSSSPLRVSIVSRLGLEN